MKKPGKPRIQLFKIYVRDRERIRHLREQYPKIEIKATSPFRYRYSNIHRVHDRMSRWLLRHYYPKVPKKDLYFAAIAARYFNHPPTLEALLPIIKRWNHSQAIKVIAKRRRQQLQIFGSSYTIYTKGKTKKHVFICRFLTKTRANASPIRRALLTHSMEQLTLELRRIPGIGEFMAGQIAADLSYIIPMDDVHVYTPSGPGAIKGLNAYFNMPANTTWDNGAFLSALQDIRKHMPHTATLHDTQNALCGFQKYLKVRSGGRGTLYKPNLDHLP